MTFSSAASPSDRSACFLKRNRTYSLKEDAEKLGLEEFADEDQVGSHLRVVKLNRGNSCDIQYFRVDFLIEGKAIVLDGECFARWQHLGIGDVTDLARQIGEPDLCCIAFFHVGDDSGCWTAVGEVGIEAEVEMITLTEVAANTVLEGFD